MLFVAFFGTIGILNYMHRLAHSHRLTKETLTLPVNIREINVFFITDIHRRKLNAPFFKTLRGQVDMVWIGGDLLEKGVSAEQLKENLTILNKIGKIFFVWGNNDYEWPQSELTKLFEDHEVTVLKNQCYPFSEYGDVWTLAGVDDLSTGELDYEKTIQGAAGPCILLSHNPDIVNELPSFMNIVYLLSGHTHGGQIRLGPFGIAEKGGWKRKNDIPMLISHGYGTTKLPLRLGTEAEAHLINIRSRR